METNHNGFSKEATAEAQALFDEAVKWQSRNSTGSSKNWWEQEVTMTLSQIVGRALLLVGITAAVSAFATVNRQCIGFSVPPKMAVKEVRFLDHRTRKLSPLPTEDCEALELCEKCGKWHGGSCPPAGLAAPSATARAPSTPASLPASPRGPLRPPGRPAGP